MREQNRMLEDVCRDPDLPSICTCRKYKREYPELEEKIRQAYYSMPYKLQLRRNILSPEFIAECKRLADRNMSINAIAETIGVSSSPVRRALLAAGGEEKRKGKTKSDARPSSPKRYSPQGMRAAKKWRREDFEAIPERMRYQQRSLQDVCGDPDLPSLSSWRFFVKKQPEMDEKARKIFHALPYATQLRHRGVSPRFLEDCRRLFARGMLTVYIAKALGVSTIPVKRVLRESGDYKLSVVGGRAVNS